MAHTLLNLDVTRTKPKFIHYCFGTYWQKFYAFEYIVFQVTNSMLKVLFTFIVKS